MKHIMLVLLLASALCCRGEETPAGRKYALLIGVQKYDGSDLGNLKFCENDVDELAAVLKGPAYNYNRVKLLTRTEAMKNIDRDDILPTAENIRAHLKGVLSDCKAYDTVLVAFAGHGIQLKLDGKMYFCPAKCNLNKRESLICIDEIYAELGKTKANSKILLVDACRDDPLSKRGTDDRINSLTMPLIPDPPGGTVAMFSCCKGQSARENEKYKHGYLFKYLIDGMNGNPHVQNQRSGDVTWLKLAGYVAEEVKDQVKEDYGPEVLQTPEVKGESIDLVLGRVELIPVVMLPNAVIQPDSKSVKFDQSEYKLFDELVTKDGVIHRGQVSEMTNGNYGFCDQSGNLVQEIRKETIRSIRKGVNELTLDLGDGLKMELVKIPKGTFTMGDNLVHKATISRDFYMGKYHVTQEQYRAVMGANPSYYRSNDRPVEKVSWDDAVAFCAKLSHLSGKRIELPTEAQWEKACRSGTTTKFYTGDSDDDLDRAGWYDKNSDNQTHSVGQKEANSYGLYDMHGNVFQWCKDWYASDNHNTQTDPSGPATGTTRVLRGGAWDGFSAICRSGSRYNSTPGDKEITIGFRVVVLGLD